MPDPCVHDPGHKSGLDGLEYYIGNDQYGADDHCFFIVPEKGEVFFHVPLCGTGGFGGKGISLLDDREGEEKEV